ncbi:histidine kinase [Actinomycetospora succinea]|uniref:Histidine kinase n=1 Tax=Actinomycetospora succinea TaxID=663603 RepID=A0A4R6UP90_9PSEU|nr:histidine kinase [Actinomycetospora succinea]TDQ47045.1 histidine kinase [Actinomycetospora succinea]
MEEPRGVVPVVAGPERLATLLRSLTALARGGDLDTVLRSLVTAAADLTEARHGVLRVLGEDGATGPVATTGVEQPPSATRLEVPLRVRGRVVGGLTLTDRRHGDFTADDDKAAIAVAGAAAVAVEHARLLGDTRRLLDEAQRRERRLEASGEITTQVLAGADPEDVLVLAAERATELCDGVGAVITTPPAAVAEGDVAPPVRVTVSVGLEDPLPVGARVAAASSPLAEVARTRVPRVEVDLVLGVDGFPRRLGPALLVPLDGGSEVITGVLVVVRDAATGGLDTDRLSTVASFADQAALVLRLAESQRARRQLDVAADRERIAADLHDHVLQRLFALGLGLQATQARLRTHPDAASRVNEAVDQVDGIVRDIRTSIFDLHAVDGAPGLGGRLRGAVAEMAVHVETEPVVRLSGPVDTVPEALAAQVEAVVREGVSNAIRHGDAQSVIVTVSVDTVLAVGVTDDGVGIPDTVARSGLANLVARARALGGDSDVGRRSPGPGTRLTWWVPFDPPAPTERTLP